MNPICVRCQAVILEWPSVLIVSRPGARAEQVVLCLECLDLVSAFLGRPAARPNRVKTACTH
jgi:hypothetical protein